MEAAALSTSSAIHLGDLVHAEVEEGEACAALDAVHARQPALRHRQPLQLPHALQPNDLRYGLQMQRERLQVWVTSKDVHVAVGQAVHEELEVGDCARLLLVIRARDAAGAQVVEVDACSVVRAGSVVSRLTVRLPLRLLAPSSQGKRPQAAHAHAAARSRQYSAAQPGQPGRKASRGADV